MYFRRIVEEQWQCLVTEIRKAAERLGVEDLKVYDAALQETQFSNAVEMLADAIPEKLLILGGENPLTQGIAGTGTGNDILRTGKID